MSQFWDIIINLFFSPICKARDQLPANQVSSSSSLSTFILWWTWLVPSVGWVQFDDTSKFTTPSYFPLEGWLSVRPSSGQSIWVSSGQVFLGWPWPWPPLGLSFWISSANHHHVRHGHAIWDAGAEYLILQLIKLHPLQDILWADMVLGDTTYQLDHSWDIALQVMQIRWVWSKRFDIRVHVVHISNVIITNTLQSLSSLI